MSKKTKPQKEESPAQRARRLQATNTRERGSIKVIEKARKLIRAVEGAGNAPVTALVTEAVTLLEREVVRLRREKVRTEIRLERTVGSLLPRLKSKANEVRELRKKLYPTSGGSRRARVSVPPILPGESEIIARNCGAGSCRTKTLGTEKV